MCTALGEKGITTKIRVNQGGTMVFQKIRRQLHVTRNGGFVLQCCNMQMKFKTSVVYSSFVVFDYQNEKKKPTTI